MSEDHVPTLAHGEYDRRPPSQYDDERLREAYGRVRGFFLARPERYRAIERALTAARMPESYDRYLTRGVRRAAAAGVVGLVVGVLAAAWLVGTVGLLGLLTPAVTMPVFAGGVWLAHYHWPRFRAHERGREIEVVLPHAIVFLYALTHAGMNATEAFDRLADAEDTYGPVAVEFRHITADTERFGVNLFDAIATARDATSSGRFESFLDELVSVLESGGDVESFLEDEVGAQLERAEEAQEQVLSDLGVLAQVYIAAVFAGPTFLIVILLVVNLIAGDVLLPIRLLVYVGIPLSIGAFALAIHRLNRPFRHPAGTVTSSTEVEPPEWADERLEAYREATETGPVERFRADPLGTSQDHPWLSLVVTVPLSLVGVAALFLAGVVPFAWSAMVEQPVLTTAGVFAVPFLVTATPLAVLVWLRRHRERAVRQHLPDALDVLADANENEVPLAESFGLVADRTAGPLSAELHRVRNDVGWTHDVRGALRRFGGRLQVPAVARLVRLLGEAARATGDLGGVFRHVSQDMHVRNHLRRQRRQHMDQYVIIVVIGVLVYLSIVAMFDLFFLPLVTDLGGGNVPRAPVQVRHASADTYRRLFFHSALLQAVCNGLLLGKLTDDALVAGLKYAVGLVVLVCLTFLVVALI